MKHAYLIIAHNEFEVLQELISALDDDRNDIYVHIDKKVKSLPELTAHRSKLFVIENRIDVRWGHISQIESEYALVEAAYYSPASYSRYHLISGTHLPLKRQDEIHAFFDKNRTKEFLKYFYTDSGEINFKLNKYHLFIRWMQNPSCFIQRSGNLLWRILLKFQTIFSIHKQPISVVAKANNWVALTGSAIDYIIKNKEKILKLFRYSFCGDEYFIPCLLENAGCDFEIIDCERLLFNDFGTGSSPRFLTMDDYDFLIGSEYLFARKFNSANMDVVDKILETVKNKI